MSKNTRKIIVTTLCALLLVAGSVLGTLAYLTDTTTQVQNTFTVGKVDIDLYEHEVKKDATTGAYVLDSNGKIQLDSSKEVLTNTYEKVLPGMTFPKDPTIEVETGSEDCYVGAVVTLKVKDIKKTPLWRTDYGFVDVSGLVTGGASDGTWTPNGLEFTETTTKNKIIQSAVTTANGVDTVTFTYIIAAKKTVGDKVVLFDTLHTDVNADKWTNEAIAAIDGMVITVDAYAVQAEGFTGDDAAATALHAAFADIF